MPQALLSNAPSHLRDACGCLETPGDWRILINPERAGRLGISNEMFWVCGAFLMGRALAEEARLRRALDALLAPGWSDEFASSLSGAERPAQTFTSKAGLVMFTAGGRKIGTIGVTT